jgi:hypothetical protein
MRRSALVVTVVAAVVALGGCSSPDTTAAPDVAEAPYACDGVPQRGVELALGGKGEPEQTGSWAGRGPAFSCIVRNGDPGPRVFVTYGDPSTFLSLEVAAEQQNAEPIEADVTGSGYVFGGSKPTAMWVCDAHVLAVELLGEETEGRDGRADAENLLLSMLPWACDGADVPKGAA